MTDTPDYIYNETFGMCFFIDENYNLYSAPAIADSNEPDLENIMAVAEWEDREDVASNKPSIPLKWKKLFHIYSRLMRHHHFWPS